MSEQVVLLPRFTYFGQYAAKLRTQVLLALQAGEIRDDLQAHQALVVGVVAIAMRISTHEAERAREYCF
jgi:hypothetical protein